MKLSSFAAFLATQEGVLVPDKAPATGLPRFNATGRTNAERKRLKVNQHPVHPLGHPVHQVVPPHLIPRNLLPLDVAAGLPRHYFR